MYHVFGVVATVSAHGLVPWCSGHAAKLESPLGWLYLFLFNFNKVVPDHEKGRFMAGVLSPEVECSLVPQDGESSIFPFPIPLSALVYFNEITNSQ